MICSLGSFEITSRGVTSALVATYRLLPSLPTARTMRGKHPHSPSTVDFDSRNLSRTVLPDPVYALSAPPSIPLPPKREH